MDKNMREPRWKVSRLGFDNFIMTSRACFVVITDCPELWLDLYCDRHLTPRTVIQSHHLPPPPPPVNKLEIFHVWLSDPAISVPSQANDHFLWTVKFLKYTGGPPAALYLRFNALEKCWNYVLIQFGVMFQLWGPGQTDWPIFMTIIGPFPVIRAHTAS